MIPCYKKSIRIFHEHLREARLICGLTSSELADMAGISNSMLLRYENPNNSLQMPKCRYLAIRAVLLDYAQTNLAYPITCADIALRYLWSTDENERSKILAIVNGFDVLAPVRNANGRYRSCKEIGIEIRRRWIRWYAENEVDENGQ